MSDKFSNAPMKEQGGHGIAQWMEHFCNIDKQTGLNKGFNLSCKDLNGSEKNLPINRVGILMENCSMMRQGTSTNHGLGGSNCATGKPVAFVDFISVFPAVFDNSRQGILATCRQPCFVLPLCQIDSQTDLTTIMVEAYTEFVSQKKGNIKHDETHIANGICSGLSAICFALCEEITLNGKKPDANRMNFLVEALYMLSLTARSVAKHLEQCSKIFKLMPYVASTADTFQSTLMAFIFDEMPCESIRVKQVSSSIFRYFTNNSWSTSYVNTNPTGLIGLLLVSPMLSSMITTDLETNQIINTIVRSINEAITSIVSQSKHNPKNGFEQKTSSIHIQNKMILTEFAKATTVPFVRAELIDKIYDAVLNGQHDVASYIGISEHATFVRSGTLFTLNNKPSTNNAIMIHSDQENNVATYLPSDPREWTAISLEPGAKYLMKAPTLGNADFKLGNTVGEQNVANFRFTVGSELMKGSYRGYSANGVDYLPETKQFTSRRFCTIDPNKEFTIISGPCRLIVLQDGVNENIIRIDNDGQLALSPTICFKFCTVKITLVSWIPLLATNNDEKIEPTLLNSEIESCLSLADSFNNIYVNRKQHYSARNNSQGHQQWGQDSANKLHNSNRNRKF